MVPSRLNAPWCSPRLLLPCVATCDDEFGSGFILAGLFALGGKAPRRHWMPSARSAALAAAMRMVDRIHRHAAIVRHAAHPALASSLADRNIHVVRMETAPIVAMQRPCTMRCSPELRRKMTY